MDNLFIISGPSGSGKTTIMKKVLDNDVTTITTRPMREGEINGIDYYFVSLDEFKQYIRNGELIEYNKYINGHFYGITKEKLKDQLINGDVYNIVEKNGMLKYKKYFPNLISIFIYTTYDDIKKQLTERGGDSTDIQIRLKSYESELIDAHLYDYVIKNKYGKSNETAKIIQDIINAEK